MTEQQTSIQCVVFDNNNDAFKHGKHGKGGIWYTWTNERKQ